MKLRRIRATIRGPLILFVTSLVLVVALLVLWNVVLAFDYQRIVELAAQAEEEGAAAFHWTFIALGSAFFVAIIVLLSILGAQLLIQIRYNQRLASFVATFTHELNSPLASIKLFAQTLRRPDLSPADRERFLGLILTDVERLRAQLGNVLRTAQVDSPHGLQIAPEPTELRAYLEAFAAERRVAVERLDGEVTIALEEGPPAWASIDRLIFRQALDNLIDNAIKYRKAGEPAQVTLALEPLRVEGGEAVALEVRDGGCGIPREALRRVFERYQRLQPDEAARPTQAGTGLGLWIVATIVDAHGGDVEARSEGPGTGTTIRIVLPGLRPREQALAEAVATGEGAA